MSDRPLTPELTYWAGQMLRWGWDLATMSWFILSVAVGGLLTKMMAEPR